MPFFSAKSLFILTLFFLTNLSGGKVGQAEKPIDPRITPEVLEAFKAKEHYHNEMTLPYRLLSPLKVEEGKSYPLVLFLHGMGERGTDNQRQLVHGGSVMASQDFRERHPAFIVAPQCPGGIEPGMNPKGKQEGEEAQRAWTWLLPISITSEIDLEESPCPQLLALHSLLTELKKTLPIDSDQVHVTGLSMGGYAAWELATRYPELFASALPVCGAGDKRHAKRLTALPIWAFHGSVDSVVPVDCSRTMVSAIKAAGGKPIYTEYDNTGHDSWTATYNSQHVWDWIFAQHQ